MAKCEQRRRRPEERAHSTVPPAAEPATPAEVASDPFHRVTVEYLAPTHDAKTPAPVTRDFADETEARRFVEAAKADPRAWHVYATRMTPRGSGFVMLSLYRSLEVNEWRDNSDSSVR